MTARLGALVRALPPPRTWPALMRQRSVARFLLLLAILAACAVSVLFLPQPDLATAPRLVDRLGPFAPPAAIVLGALMMVVLVPRTLVSFAWGALFGTVGVPATRWGPHCSPPRSASGSAGCWAAPSWPNGYAAGSPAWTAGSPGRACWAW
ncbi:hypothetical protein Pflav_002910 [Phytohabitans flavus]|uniref:Uncharacterized protein n=1 Tax=Phytohabitans flavus TaxID=1076124 RepID=A0A6F8XJB3_9ACTN|nr:hypothetical protein Pflav_002910 [Phytohabitans flavus]